MRHISGRDPEKVRAYNRAYYRKNKKVMKDSATQYNRRARSSSDPRVRATSMLCRKRAEARRRGVRFALTRKWLSNVLDDGRCEVTGVPFVFDGTRNGRPHPLSPSLDQRVPGGGYTQQNTQVVIYAYNCAKGDWTGDVVLQMAEALVKRSRKGKVTK